MSRRIACLLFGTLLLVIFVAGCGGSGSGGSQDPSVNALAASTTSPAVSCTSPIKAAGHVATNGKITATFTEEMSLATITTDTFVLSHGTTPVSGTVTYAHRAAIFTPTSALSPNTEFTANITRDARNVGGRPLSHAFFWSFTTGAIADTTAPTVEFTIPVKDATGISLNRAIAVSFNEAIDPATITSSSFTLKRGATPVAGVTDYAPELDTTSETAGLGANNTTSYYAGRNATFFPAANLVPHTAYTATITTEVKDLAGNALAHARVWSFTTGGGTDTTAPTVISTNPAKAALGVSLQHTVSATFKEAMASSTMTTERFTLREGSNRVLGTVTYANRVATFTPLLNLKPCTLYDATLTTGIRDLTGKPLASNYTWQFKTGQATVNLRSAWPFAILAYSTVTNTALQSTVNGDLGLSPGTAVTGFPPGIMNGTMHKADPIAAKAKLDLTTAYNDAAGRTCSSIVGVAGNLGGKTLYPGLYKSTSSLEISSGDLTLDARGDKNAVFIFQMASTFTMTAGRQIILSGGANPANIFWQVGTSATLGSTSVVKGNLLANVSITMNTGATAVGRLMARTGAVTLDGNTVTRP